MPGDERAAVLYAGCRQACRALLPVHRLAVMPERQFSAQVSDRTISV